LIDEIELHQLVHLEMSGMALSYFFMRKSLDRLVIDEKKKRSGGGGGTSGGGQQTSTDINNTSILLR
jgi:hypothetical protein